MIQKGYSSEVPSGPKGLGMTLKYALTLTARVGSHLSKAPLCRALCTPFGLYQLWQVARAAKPGSEPQDAA